jgi:hypothetical protein
VSRLFRVREQIGDRSTNAAASLGTLRAATGRRGDPMTTTEGATTTRALDRRTGIAGLVFFVLFVIGWLVGGDRPDYDAPDAEWTSWFEDDDNRIGSIAAMFTLALSAMAFVPFLTGVLRRVRAVTDAEGLPMIALGAGLIFSATTIVAAVAVHQVAAAIEFGGDYPVPGADVLRQAEQLGFGIGLLGGGWAAALCVAAISWAARGTVSLPA